MLATARLQLQHLPAHLARDSWPGQLTILEGALRRLDALDKQWQQTRAQLPADAAPGTEAYVDALDEHHAECWSYLDDWACQGRVILDINTATQEHARTLRQNTVVSHLPSTPETPPKPTAAHRGRA
ncbi:hypothetical protein ACFT5D_33380 [Streptomyces sp. NPDC057144]|uniref:hypothetical protein n=1 Tax=Streptomyces sp. NPDC057144 TaxID=3346034 RepID=UPI003635BD82